jgi:hypothetical protein
MHLLALCAYMQRHGARMQPALAELPSLLLSCLFVLQACWLLEVSLAAPRIQG